MPVESPGIASLHKNTPADCQVLIAHLLASQTLQRSPRLRELLSYLAEATLTGDVARLKEPAIGSAVYGRPDGYNTNDDNVVRMGVSQLRRKLAEYFAGEGQNETMQLDVPRGQYALRFRMVVTENEAASEELTPPLAVGPVVTTSGRRWRTVALAAVVLLAIGLTCWWAGRPAKAKPAEGAFWQQAIGDGSGTLFVPEDVDFLAAVTATGQRPPLEAYADGRKNALAASGIVQFSPVPATTQLSLRIATQLAAHQPERFGRVRFVAAGEVRMQDFKETNVILVGSPRACPWLILFEDSMNFQFEHDPVRLVSGFRNRKPEHGEPKSYRAAPSDGVGGKVYSTVALLPNLTRSGHVLILMGTRTEGTAAAAEAVTTPRILDAILSAVGYTGSGPLPYFEALLESRVVGNATAAPELVTVRRYSPDEPTLSVLVK